MHEHAELAVGEISRLVGPRGTSRVVTIVGTSAGGKSTLAELCAAVFGADCVRLDLDQYLIQADRRHARTVFAKYQLRRFGHDVAALNSGVAVFAPSFDRLSGLEAGERLLKPARLILVDGILALFPLEPRRSTALTFYVDAPADVRLERQVQRALADDRYPGLTSDELRERFAEKTITEDPHIARQAALADWLLDTASGAVARGRGRGARVRVAA